MSENLVIVRAFGQKALVRAILDQMPNGVLVCMRENAEPIRSGEFPEPMVGFR